MPASADLVRIACLSHCSKSSVGLLWFIHNHKHPQPWTIWPVQRHVRSHDSADADMQEVEKEVAEEVPGKKSRKRTIREMEYCYEAELEGEILSTCWA